MQSRMTFEIELKVTGYIDKISTVIFQGNFSYLFFIELLGQFVLVTWYSLGSLRRLFPDTPSNVSQYVVLDQEFQ